MKRILIALLFLSSTAAISAPTQIRDTLRISPTRVWSGRIEVSWPAYNYETSYYPRGTTSISVSNGIISTALNPNIGATPAGTVYTARYYYNNTLQSTEYWQVPTSLTSVRVKDIVVAVIPTPSLMLPLAQLSQSGANIGEVPKWNGASWVPSGSAGGQFYASASGYPILGDSVRLGEGYGISFVQVGNMIYAVIDSVKWATAVALTAKADGNHTHTSFADLLISNALSLSNATQYPQGSLLAVDAGQVIGVSGSPDTYLQWDGANWGAALPVTSLNNHVGAIRLVGAGGATVTSSGDTITITAGGGEGGTITAIQNTDGRLSIVNASGTVTINVNTLDSTALQTGSVTSSKIRDGSINRIDLVNAIIDSTALATGAVTSTKILDGSINTADVSANFIAPRATRADSAAKVDTVSFPVITLHDLIGYLATKANLVHTHGAGDVTSGTFGYARLGSGVPASNHVLLYNGSSQAWQLLTMSQLPDVEGTATMDALTDSVFVTYASATASMECQATWLKDNGLYPYGTLTVRPVAGSGFWVISTADEADACRFRYRIGTK
jgi:hypothetical protein